MKTRVIENIRMLLLPKTVASNYWGESGRELIEFLLPHLPGGAEDNLEEPQAIRQCAGTDSKRAPTEHKPYS